MKWRSWRCTHLIIGVPGLKNSFWDSYLSFATILIGHNHVANRLSKEALDFVAGNLLVQEYLEDALNHEHTFIFSFYDAYI